MNDSAASWTIIPLAPDRWAEGLDLLHRNVAESIRREQIGQELAILATEPLAAQGLLGATNAQGHVCGVVWAQLQQGRIAHLWQPAVEHPGLDALKPRLLAAAVMVIDSADIDIAQALLAEEDEAAEQHLRDVGFTHISDLLYLVLPLKPRTAPPQPPQTAAEGMQWEIFHPSDRGRLGALLEQTYIDSQDCPALNGRRAIDDVIEGYQSVGQFAPQRWLLLRHDGQDIGCLLLAAHSEQRQWELVYMGLIPSARGRGWGRLLVSEACRRATQGGARQLIAAVDADNSTALACYTAAGFVIWAQRSVWIRFRAGV